MCPAGRRPPSLCSPLPANPCGSVSGSKIFTFPPPDFDLSAARRPPLFAPPSPRTLVAPFRGAKSSHFRRRISTSLSPGACPLFAPRYPQTLVAPFRGAKFSHSRRRITSSQALGGALSLLPPHREPLQLRFGEQNLHISVARFLPLCRPAAPSLCSPLPVNPCSSVPGSKIFTFPPSDFDLPGARRLFLFAPRSPQTLVVPFRGAKSSHSRRPISPSRPSGGSMLPKALPQIPEKPKSTPSDCIFSVQV